MAGIGDSTGVQFDLTGTLGSDFSDHILTDLYLPKIADARNNSSVLWSLLPKEPYPTSGKFITWPIKTARSRGVSAIRLGSGKMPEAGFQGADTQTQAIRGIYARLKIDGPTMDASKSDPGSYLRALDLEVNGIMDDISIYQNRVCHNDGSGRLAQVNGTPGGTTVTLEVNQGIESPTTCDTKPTLYLEEMQKGANEGQLLMFSTAGGASTAVTTLVSVDSDTDITVGSTTGIADGDWVTVSAGNYTSSEIESSGFKSEPMGIAGIYSDAGVLDGNGAASGQTGSLDYTTTTSDFFQGVNATTEAWNQAVVLSGSAGKRPLTEELMQQAISDAEETNNAMVELLLSSYATYNSYVKLLTPDKRYNDTLELKGGHRVLSFNGIGWVKDRYCYGNRVYFMGFDQFMVWENSPLNWLDFDGDRWKSFQDDHAYWAGLYTYYNMGVYVRNKTGALLTDLQD